jgi:hypothetical protein
MEVCLRGAEEVLLTIMPFDFFCYFFAYLTPNVAADWLTLLLRIREALGSNLDPETGYPD